MTRLEAVESALLPTAFTARTRSRYAVPLVNPVITWLVAVELKATATSPTRLTSIDRRHFLFLVHETPMFAIQVMSTLADRLRP